MADAGPRPEPSQEAGSLVREMRTLATVIRELEAQQDKLIAANNDLKRDLETERRQRAVAVGELDELHGRLRRTQQELADREQLARRAAELGHERSHLVAAVQELREQLARQDGEERDQQQQVEHLHTTRADLLKELGNVESQFERVMSMVVQLTSRLAAARDETSALQEQLRGTQERVDLMQDERDALLSEVDQSRSALDEIRQSLADAYLGPGDLPPGGQR